MPSGKLDQVENWHSSSCLRQVPARILWNNWSNRNQLKLCHFKGTISEMFDMKSNTEVCSGSRPIVESQETSEMMHWQRARYNGENTPLSCKDARTIRNRFFSNSSSWHCHAWALLRALLNHMTSTIPCSALGKFVPGKFVPGKFVPKRAYMLILLRSLIPIPLDGWNLHVCFRNSIKQNHFVFICVLIK
jgi:hypothetical protein